MQGGNLNLVILELISVAMVHETGLLPKKPEKNCHVLFSACTFLVV